MNSQRWERESLLLAVRNEVDHIEHGLDDGTFKVVVAFIL